jgi:phosphoenolpyruvate-protein phosphotransferase (PTS system enzyme I)
MATESGLGITAAILTGSRIAPGLAMGRAWLVGHTPEQAVRRIQDDQVEPELRRIHGAFEQTRAELGEAARRVEEQFSADLGRIFRAHEMMLDGMRASTEFGDELKGSLINAEAAVRRVLRRWQEKFRSLKDESFRQHADDLADIGRKVLRHLDGEDTDRLQHLPAGSILVLRRLLPSDVVSLSRRRVAAIVVESLGQGSHAALLAREKSIPTVANFPGLMERVRDGDELLVDAARGELVIAPDADQRAEFAERLRSRQATLAYIIGACHEAARTLDGVRVVVEANLGTPEDVALALDNGADGVGLLRTEQLYWGRDTPPTQEELLDALRTLTRPLRDKPLTIRLLDIGGDKPLSFLTLPAEANPALGQRGVRVLLEYPHLTQTQIDTLLRLAQEQPIRVLVPMVTLEEDIQAMRALFEARCSALGLAQRPAFGAMIETPAAALNVPAIARHVDFLCVGTNDLTQYTLAVGRDDPTVSRYFLDTHASLLRLLAIIVADAGAMPLTLCGELAGREEMIPQLLAIGFRSLSLAPTLIPGTKDLIRSLRISSTTRGHAAGRP